MFRSKHKYGFSPVHSKIEPATANKKAPEGGSTKPWSQVVVKPGGWEYYSRWEWWACQDDNNVGDNDNGGTCWRWRKLTQQEQQVQPWRGLRASHILGPTEDRIESWAMNAAISNDKLKSYLLLNLHNNWHLRAGPSLEVKIEFELCKKNAQPSL